MGCYALTKPLHAYMTYCHVRLGYYTSNMPLISEAYERRSQRLTNHLIAVTTRVPDHYEDPSGAPPGVRGVLELRESLLLYVAVRPTACSRELPS